MVRKYKSGCLEAKKKVCAHNDDNPHEHPNNLTIDLTVLLKGSQDPGSQLTSRQRSILVNFQAEIIQCWMHKLCLFCGSKTEINIRQISPFCVASTN